LYPSVEKEFGSQPCHLRELFEVDWGRGAHYGSSRLVNCYFGYCRGLALANCYFAGPPQGCDNVAYPDLLNLPPISFELDVADS
jgi:hypothetical protein